MTTARDRYRGCLLGGAIRDALGAGTEFLSLAEIRQRHGPAGVRSYAPAYGRTGAITDDCLSALHAGHPGTVSRPVNNSKAAAASCASHQLGPQPLRPSLGA